MAKAVLDASAVLALLNAEQGAEVVLTVLDDAVMSAVNYAEVVTKLVDWGAGLPDIQQALAWISIHVVDFDLELARRTGMLRAGTRHLGLSLGDSACLALAEREAVPAFTGDRSWLGSVPDIEVRAIR